MLYSIPHIPYTIHPMHQRKKPQMNVFMYVFAYIDVLVACCVFVVVSMKL